MEKRFDGYITPDGHYVQLDDLEAMEKALMRCNDGSKWSVVRGLRQVSLDLAKECRGEAARRFLARAWKLCDRTATEGLEMLRLGLAFESIECFDLACECYERGRSVAKYDQKSWYFLHNNHAYCLAMLKRFAEAEALARKAIRIIQGLHNAHKNLGLALMGQGRLSEAAESFRTARDLGPTDGRAAYYLAEVEKRLRVWRRLN